MITHPLFITIALIGSVAVYNTAFVSTKDQREFQRAKLINNKATQLKDLVAISNINDYTLLNDETQTIIDTNRISHLIVPTKNIGRDVEILADKYFQATLKHFDSSTDTSTPSCNSLALTGLITEDDCNFLTSLDIEVYEYENDEVSYQVSKSISEKTISLSNNDSEAESIDTEKDKITNKGLFNESAFMEQKKTELTYKYNQKIKDYLSANNIDSAKRINDRLEKFNPRQATLNKAKYGW